MNPDSADELTTADARIAWVLAHPLMSEWLKGTLRTALAADHINIINDIELLRLLITARTEAQLSLWLENSC